MNLNLIVCFGTFASAADASSCFIVAHTAPTQTSVRRCLIAAGYSLAYALTDVRSCFTYAGDTKQISARPSVGRWNIDPPSPRFPPSAALDRHDSPLMSFLVTQPLFVYHVTQAEALQKSSKLWSYLCESEALGEDYLKRISLSTVCRFLSCCCRMWDIYCTKRKRELLCGHDGVLLRWNIPLILTH